MEDLYYDADVWRETAHWFPSRSRSDELELVRLFALRYASEFTARRRLPAELYSCFEYACRNYSSPGLAADVLHHLCSSFLNFLSPPSSSSSSSSLSRTISVAHPNECTPSDPIQVGHSIVWGPPTHFGGDPVPVYVSRLQHLRKRGASASSLFSHVVNIWAVGKTPNESRNVSVKFGGKVETELHFSSLSPENVSPAPGPFEFTPFHDTATTHTYQLDISQLYGSHSRKCVVGISSNQVVVAFRVLQLSERCPYNLFLMEFFPATQGGGLNCSLSLSGKELLNMKSTALKNNDLEAHYAKQMTGYPSFVNPHPYPNTQSISPLSNAVMGSVGLQLFQYACLKEPPATGPDYATMPVADRGIMESGDLGTVVSKVYAGLVEFRKTNSWVKQRRISAVMLDFIARVLIAHGNRHLSRSIPPEDRVRLVAAMQTVKDLLASINVKGTGTIAAKAVAGDPQYVNTASSTTNVFLKKVTTFYQLLLDLTRMKADLNDQSQRKRTQTTSRNATTKKRRRELQRTPKGRAWSPSATTPESPSLDSSGDSNTLTSSPSLSAPSLNAPPPPPLPTSPPPSLDVQDNYARQFSLNATPYSTAVDSFFIPDVGVDLLPGSDFEDFDFMDTS